MSATIFWEPVKVNVKPKSLHALAPSWFIACLERADMPLPNTFGIDNIPTLRGLAATMEEGTENPFTQLINAIEKNGPVTVWYEH